MRPRRIVLSRRGGFDLQAISHAINGLPGQSVARPGRWGNPFTIDAVMAETGLDRDAAQAEAVRRFGGWIRGEIEGPRAPPDLGMVRAELAGKNLACWCRQGSPCHVDVLLEVANE